MAASSETLTSNVGGSTYALGYTCEENERLIRQAAFLEPITERFFRGAGIGPGQRVLDLGSGLGDVSMLLARIVGPAGEVVGLEREESSIARARERVGAAGLGNVQFVRTDLGEFSNDDSFDAAVGRFILMFLPDARSVLRSVVRAVRPGGILAFQEPTWKPMMALESGLPLWFRTRTMIHETFVRYGVNPEMGIDLYRIFQEIGLPAPSTHLEIPLGATREYSEMLSQCAKSVLPLSERFGVSFAELGDFSSLANRLQSELVAANTVAPYAPLVGSWARKPSQAGG